jgi:Tol biopolymer transport system component
VDSPVWSPDSSKLAFSRAFDSPPKLFVRGIREKDAEESLPSAYFQAPADWSSDGRFILSLTRVSHKSRTNCKETYG